MKNLKKKESLYNAVSGVSEDNVAGFLKYEDTLTKKAGKPAPYHPVLRIAGAFAACLLIFGGISAGLRYLEYKSRLNGPASGTGTEAPADEKATAFRLVRKTKTASGSTSETVYEYDASGRLTKETENAQNGAQSQMIGYTYDDSGNLIKTYTDYKYAGKQRSVTEDEREYSAEGRLISKYVKKTNYMNTAECGTSWFCEKYEYDADGRRISMEQQGTGMIKTVYKYTYTDENGSYIMTGADEKTTVTFNEKGLITNTFQIIDGEERITQNEYDEHGSLTKYVFNGELQIECAYTYENDAVIREDQTSYFSGTAEKKCLIYEYDENNNVIEYTVISEDGTVVEKTVYEWDIN